MRRINCIFCIVFFILFVVSMFTRGETHIGTRMLIFACYFGILVHLEEKP